MTEKWKTEIENFESELKNVPDSHKSSVLNVYLTNTRSLQALDRSYVDINDLWYGYHPMPTRSFKLTDVIWRNPEYLKKYLGITTSRNEVFCRDMRYLKKFVRKHKCIAQMVTMYEYIDAAESEKPFYLLAYYDNTNIFKYWLQYIPFFKRKSVDDYVPRKFPIDSCPHK